MVSAEAVDPGVHLGLGRVAAGSERGVGFGDPLGLPGKASLLFRFGLNGGFGNGCGLRHGLNVSHRLAIL